MNLRRPIGWLLPSLVLAARRPAAGRLGLNLAGALRWVGPARRQWPGGAGPNWSVA